MTQISGISGNDELCGDNVDNDCDETVDEGFENLATPVPLALAAVKVLDFLNAALMALDWVLRTRESARRRRMQRLR